MKRLIALALSCAAFACAQQSVTITVSGVSPAILADIHTHWLDQTTESAGKTVADIDGTTDTITVTITLPAHPKVGQSVLIDGEPMVVSAISGLTATLHRGTLPMVTMATHPSGATIMLLKHATPWEMLVAEAVRPWAQSVIAQLGARSATFAGTFTGTVAQ